MLFTRRLVPVLAVGFPDLKVRVEAQQAESARQSVKLGELQKRLDELTSKHSLSNSVRISAISRKQTSLHQRLMGLAKRSHLLIPALRGHSITRKEEQLRSLLQSCELELETISSLSGGASGSDASAIQHRLRGRINELWAVLGTLKAKREATTAAAAGTGNAPLEWAVVDDSAIEDVVKILAAQQQGLDHLSTTLQTDARNLDTIIKGLDGVELVGVK
jgi:nuclear pore complex protein Nup54